MYYQIILNVANSDIYFDESLAYLGNASTLILSEMILALSKWVYPSGMEKVDEMSLPLRIESQDAWIFQPPVPSNILQRMDFYLGAPRCDNVLAEIFSAEGYNVINPAFSIKAIECSSKKTSDALYGQHGSVIGSGKFVFFSDRFIF